MTIMSKPNSYFQSIRKPSVKFQKHRTEIVGAHKVPSIAVFGQTMDRWTDRWTDRRTHFNTCSLLRHTSGDNLHSYKLLS